MSAELHDASLVVRVNAPRIDAAGATSFKEAMLEIVSPPSECVILDLGQVQFIDSSGLGAIISVMKSIVPARRFELAAPMPTVRRVLQLTRLDTMLTVHAEVPGSGTGQAV